MLKQIELSPYLKNLKKPIKKATTFSRELNNRSRKKKIYKRKLKFEKYSSRATKIIIK